MATLHVCDKCGKTIKTKKSIYTVDVVKDRFSLLEKHVHYCDLCSDCVDRLIKYLHGKTEG